MVSRAASGLVPSLSSAADEVALAAAMLAVVLTLAASFVKTMIPLRWLAVGGNLGFFVYGALHPSLVSLVLHGVLLPINLYRAIEMVRLTRRVTDAAAANDVTGVWLTPHMRSQRLAAGKLLFCKGDPATHLYFLADGTIEFMELGETMQAGIMFGEIAFFAPDKQRTLTARCVSDCSVLSIDESSFRQLYFQNPAFGFQLVSLVAARLIADRKRIEQRLVTPDAMVPAAE